MTEQRGPVAALEDDVVEEMDDAELDEISEFEEERDELEESGMSSAALLLVLAVGGFGLGVVVLNITFPAAAVMTDFVGDWGWILVPAPLLLFSLGAIWQYERGWLQQLGAAALGFALAQYVMFAIARQILDA